MTEGRKAGNHAINNDFDAKTHFAEVSMKSATFRLACLMAGPHLAVPTSKKHKSNIMKVKSGPADRLKVLGRFFAIHKIFKKVQYKNTSCAVLHAV